MGVWMDQQKGSKRPYELGLELGLLKEPLMQELMPSHSSWRKEFHSAMMMVFSMFLLKGPKWVQTKVRRSNDHLDFHLELMIPRQLDPH